MSTSIDKLLLIDTQLSIACPSWLTQTGKCRMAFFFEEREGERGGKERPHRVLASALRLR
jgi:hypothetical protein